MDELIIRRAKREDVAALRMFEQGVVAAERPFDVTLKPTRIEYYPIDDMVADEHVHFLVAQQGAMLIGCGFARIDAAKPFTQHVVQGYLGLMYVDPAYRGLGINGRIVAALKTWCWEKAVTELRLEAYVQNDGALRAYSKAGFLPFMVEMRMNLDTG